MPINYRDYPANWKTEIRPAILKRADNKCENCGVPINSLIIRFWDDTWEVLYDKENLDKMYDAAKEILKTAMAFINIKCTKIVLTIAHLDHDVTNNDHNNLKALCQKCHLSYDKHHHQETRNKKKSLMI
jgi:hypothetical protein